MRCGAAAAAVGCGVSAVLDCHAGRAGAGTCYARDLLNLWS